MPNENVLQTVLEKLQDQVTIDAPPLKNWLDNLNKWNKNKSVLSQKLASDSVRLSPSIDSLALEWVKTGEFPQSHQETLLDDKYPHLWERFHHAHNFAKRLEAAGFQICQKDEKAALAWLLTDFWKLYGRTAWLESVANPA